ncbi:hypothetical protein L1987_48386 [Smallanthus sonchifolius]|uniref:Uncharacterized protein n=1 Tax=Smallanthus sonchifolius TaxID=185202 RepID=A0ACB9FRH5_9ASTR|nr:hypothetical protein L1987_48386 [Smallanthus sonchifolius]
MPHTGSKRSRNNDNEDDSIEALFEDEGTLTSRSGARQGDSSQDNRPTTYGDIRRLERKAKKNKKLLKKLEDTSKVMGEKYEDMLQEEKLRRHVSSKGSCRLTLLAKR